jgi:uncharacterized membrane protein YkgB
MSTVISTIDLYLIAWLQKYSLVLARVSLFIVFFWFGILKIVAMSPANPLVESLLSRTLPHVMFQKFILFFGAYEMLIGIVFLIPGLERLAIAMLIPHMLTTALPLFFLPQIAWQSFLIPTLEGQYIIKNCVIISLAFTIAAHLHPMKQKRTSQKYCKTILA